MKIIFVALLMLSHSISTQIQSKMEKKSARIKAAKLDSLAKKTVSPAQLTAKYKANRPNWVEVPFAEERLVLPNGAEAIFQTSNNKKVKELLSSLFSISPVDFLLGMTGIEGLILIKTDRLAWVKKEDVAQLLKLANIDVVTPEIRQLINNQPSSKFKPRYIQTPLGINALDLIHNYFNEIFPAAGTPSYASVKEWHDSGKPKEAYKLVLNSPIMGIGPIIKQNIKKVN